MAPITSTPVIKQGWLRAIVFMLSFFVCAVLAGLVAGLFIVASPAANGIASTPSNTTLLALLLTAIISISLTIVFRRFIDRQPLMSMGFAWRTHQRDAWIAFCLGPALLGIGTLLLFAHKNISWTGLAFPAADLFIALVLMVMIALAEEMVFRGYILNNLLTAMNKWVALLISAALFAVAHASNPGITFIAAVNLLLGGLLLGINYIYTRNLWFSVFFHFSWNFFQGPVLGFDVSGLPLHSVLEPALKGPSLLTGAAFGFEGSFLTTILFAIVLLLLYALYENRYGKGFSFFK